MNSIARPLLGARPESFSHCTQNREGSIPEFANPAEASVITAGLFPKIRSLTNGAAGAKTWAASRNKGGSPFGWGCIFEKRLSRPVPYRLTDSQESADD